jgi:hypothetical protein
MWHGQDEETTAQPWGQIGVPEMWPLSKILSSPRKNQKRKIGKLMRTDTLTPIDNAALEAKLEEADFYLYRLDISLRLNPPKTPDVRIDQAGFTMRLVPEDSSEVDRPRVYDLDPKQVAKPITLSSEKELKPTLEFGDLKGSVGGIKHTVAYDELTPIVTGTGAGTAAASWDYRPFKKESIAGSKRMYVIVRAPPGTQSCRASLDLQTRVSVAGRILGVFRRPTTPAGQNVELQIWPTVKVAKPGSTA